jgi:hypothetical protein
MSEDPLAAAEATAKLSLNTEERERLSKALFPDTHTETIEVLGIERELRPLPIKWARKLHSITSPVAVKIQNSINSKKQQEFDVQLLDASMKAATMLAQFYGWEDVEEALKEEEILMDDVQILLVEQATLQRANDFLLNPLRVVLGGRRLAEVGMIQFQSISNGQRSLSNITALLTGSSVDTPSLS